MLSVKKKKLIIKLSIRRRRKKLPFYLVEGVNCSAEALKKLPQSISFAVVSEFLTPSFFNKLQEISKEYSFSIFTVNNKEFLELSDTENPQGILLVMKKENVFSTPSEDPFMLVLDKIANPGNMGTIARTAWAAGLHNIYITKGTTDPYGSKAIRAGMGAQFNLNFIEVENLDEIRNNLKKKGGDIWLAVPQAKVSCFDENFCYKNNALVIGNEANGVTLSSKNDRFVTIPMPGQSESLNAAQAASIIIFESVRRGIL
ncbi:MAG: RNA methyltransferase [Verrucomicrobiota bacterium]|nr:RNA methyltransferase [Verrucomicrobiota bacterium]